MTSEYHDDRLVIRLEGRRVATPLFIALIAIGSSDLLFALDSIPAVFGVTDEPFIVFAAYAFALLGLRALYFLVTGLLDRLVYLSSGLSLILAFIGGKLLLHYGPSPERGHPRDRHLDVVARHPRRARGHRRRVAAEGPPRPDARAHAGALRDRRERRDAQNA